MAEKVVHMCRSRKRQSPFEAKEGSPPKRTVLCTTDPPKDDTIALSVSEEECLILSNCLLLNILRFFSYSI